jgi:hypothetical protein
MSSVSLDQESPALCAFRDLAERIIEADFDIDQLGTPEHDIELICAENNATLEDLVHTAGEIARLRLEADTRAMFHAARMDAIRAQADAVQRYNHHFMVRD